MRRNLQLALHAASLLLIASRAAWGVVVGGYAVSTDSRIAFVAGDGETTFPIVLDTVQNITGLANGNVVARIGTDLWRLYDAEGNELFTRQLDNLGTFNDAVPTGNGGYAALTDANIILMAANGDTVNRVIDDALSFATPLSNGKVVALKGADLWRLYDADGANVVTRALDNSGVFNSAAALGGGGYAAVSDSRILFIGSDGLTVNNVVTDVVSSLTSLRTGNVVGRVGADVWKLYSPTGSVLATRALDNLGVFQGAAALGNGGYLAYSDTNAIFVAADGLTISNIVPNALEFVTALNNGNVVGRLAGSDLWRLFDPLGNILATRQLDNIGAFVGAAPTGLSAPVNLPGDYNLNGSVDAADYTIWRDNLGSTTNLAADGDNSGVIDAPDYDIWKLAFSPVATVVAGASVPEPASVLLATIAAMLLVRRRN